MFPSDRFMNAVHRYLRDSRDTADEREQIDTIRRQFRSAVPQLPVELTDELLDHFTDRTAADLSLQPEHDGDPVPALLARMLGDAIDLFQGKYDEENEPFSREDWEAIASAVSDSALELEMETVNYVMKLVVEHHGV